MADPKTTRPEGATGTGTGQALAHPDRERRSLQRWDPLSGSLATSANPLALMDRMSDEIDRLFDRLSRDLGGPRRSWLPRSLVESPTRQAIWSPRVEAFQHGDRFIVRAELPGVRKEDLQLEITDDAVTIHGERHEEHEESREGYYHSEREYGQFYRTIPLPEGVISDSAQATFRDGVLEITMQAAPSRGRKLEIKEGTQGEQKK
jgi:HSP20 family protein